MVVIKVKKNESIDRALRRFKTKCQRAGLNKAVRRSRQFIKPSERRRIAKQAGKRRQRKAMMQLSQ